MSLEILAVKCPILNNKKGMPSREVVLRIEQPKGKVEGIICTECYVSKDGRKSHCKYNDKKPCYYHLREFTFFK